MIDDRNGTPCRLATRRSVMRRALGRDAVLTCSSVRTDASLLVVVTSALLSVAGRAPLLEVRLDLLAPRGDVDLRTRPAALRQALLAEDIPYPGVLARRGHACREVRGDHRHARRRPE